jgi:hypothetical protein
VSSRWAARQPVLLALATSSSTPIPGANIRAAPGRSPTGGAYTKQPRSPYRWHAAVSLPRCGWTRSSADRSWTGTSMRGAPGAAIRGASVGCGSSAVSPSAATIAVCSSGAG